VEEWRCAVYAHPTIKDGVRVYLLKLADHMRADRTVSVPRRTIARQLGKSERRIDERNKEARAAGLIDVVVRGQKNVTAVFVGLFPEPLSATDGGRAETTLSATESSALRTADGGRAEKGFSATPGGRTSSKRPPTSYAVGEVSDEKRQLGEVPHESTAEVRDRARREYDEEASA
jgi:hypothetical protein